MALYYKTGEFLKEVSSHMNFL